MFVDDSYVEVKYRKNANNINFSYEEYSIKHKRTIIAEDFVILLISGSGFSAEWSGHNVNSEDSVLFFLYGGERLSLKNIKSKINIIQITFGDNFLYPFEEHTVSYLSINYSKRKIYHKLSENELCDIRSIIEKIKQRADIINKFNRVYLISAINWLLLQYMIIESRNETREVDSHDYLEKILVLLNNEFFKDYFSPGYISERMNITPSHLSHIFKRQFGVTPTEYIRNRRLKFAKELIIESDSKLKNIAINAGFKSYSNFVKSFKKRYGLNPMDLRKNDNGSLSEDE